MASIKWTRKAREDLVQIRDRIATDSRDHATAMLERIRAKIESCRAFPLASTRVGEWDREDLRETYVGRYRVIYQFTQNTIYVLAVIHSAQRLPSAERILKRKRDADAP